MSPFSKLYSENKDDLYRYALSILNDPGKALDVVHDVFTKVFEMAQSNGNLKVLTRAYLYRAVRNRAIDEIRGKKFEITFDLLLDQATPAFDPDRNEIFEELRRHFNNLKEDEKEVILLKVICSNSFLQISQVMHLKVFTVASKYYRALGKLQKQMERFL